MSIHIERIQVEEGFLADLDVRFKPGLNTIIGARGTGKTSIIELIRFCLDVKPLTERTSQVFQQTALSVLGSGQVTITVNVDGERIAVSRSATDQRPRVRLPSSRFTILSQNEIEFVGVESSGRLALIDQFRDPSILEEGDLQGAEIASLTTEIAQVSAQLREVANQIEDLATVPQERAAVEDEQGRLLASASSTRETQEKLTKVQSSVAARAVRQSVFERSSAALGSLRSQLIRLRGAAPTLEAWPEAAMGADALVEVRANLNKAAHALASAAGEVDSALKRLQRLSESNQRERTEIEGEARVLRAELERLQEGASQVSRRLMVLREKEGQLSALQQLSADRTKQLQKVFHSRGEQFELQRNARAQRFAQRKTVAAKLNRELGPRIRVKVDASAQTIAYSSAIANALRGTGLHYNSLAPQLATKLNPRELVEAVETGDALVIAQAAELDVTRAQRIISGISAAGTREILAAAIEDSVTLSLLDGANYKETPSMSTGQRCTVILPIILSHHDRVIVVDQPEDHLDNAYVSDTLVEALRRRQRSDQLIFATHNANIPVLGEADQVMVMASDGRRGYAKVVGPLDDDRVVEGIATIMEGGREAFLRRAAFYNEHMH